MLKMRVNFPIVKMNVNMGKITYLGGELYDGECDVIPNTFDQTLKTAQKFMPRDVTVKAVPYAELPNTSGGNTAVIGLE